MNANALLGGHSFRYSCRLKCDKPKPPRLMLVIGLHVHCAWPKHTEASPQCIWVEGEGQPRWLCHKGMHYS